MNCQDSAIKWELSIVYSFSTHCVYCFWKFDFMIQMKYFCRTLIYHAVFYVPVWQCCEALKSLLYRPVASSFPLSCLICKLLFLKSFLKWKSSLKISCCLHSVSFCRRVMIWTMCHHPLHYLLPWAKRDTCMCSRKGFSIWITAYSVRLILMQARWTLISSCSGIIVDWEIPAMIWSVTEANSGLLSMFHPR